MTQLVIEVYRVKVILATIYLSYLLVQNINGIFKCDIWIIGLIRILHRTPWILPLFNDKETAHYQALSIPFSILFHMALLMRRTEEHYSHCELNENLEFAVYFETYLALGLYALCLIIALVMQIAYATPRKLNIKLESILFSSVIEWNQADRTCCICRDDFVETNQLSNIPCGHYEHFDCMNEWIKRTQNCPRCKKIIN